MTQKKRVLYLDVARTAAIMLISINHAANRCFEMYDEPYLEFAEMSHVMSFVKSLIIVISHMGVPLFLMITGALMLNRNYDTEQDLFRFYKKNYLHIFVTSEIWIFITYWGVAYMEHPDWYSGAGIADLLKNLVCTMLFINQITIGSLWYIPMILCVYLMIPVLSKALHALSFKAYIIPMLIVYISGMVFPGINRLLMAFEINKYYSFALKSYNISSVYLPYILIGAFIANEGLQRIRTIWLCGFAGGAAILVTCLQNQLFSMEKGYLMTYDSPAFVLIAACLFELIRRGFPGYAGENSVFSYMAVRSFAIYFIHVLIMELQIILLPLNPDHRLLYLLYLDVVSVAMSLIVIQVLSYNKWAKKWMLYM